MVQEECWHLEIETPNSSLLIGSRGKRLDAFQFLLRMAFYQQTGEWLPLLVEVNGYRRQREEKLTAMAEKAAEEALKLNSEVELPPMVPYERKIIHLALSQKEGITTESRGEGEERRVVVKPQKDAT